MNPAHLRLMLLPAAAVFAVGCAERTVYVHDRPPRQVVVENPPPPRREVIVEPAPPPPDYRERVYVEAPPTDRYEAYPGDRPGFVWVRGHYVRIGHRYDWEPGHYERIPNGHVHYEPGYWDHRGDGYYWREGRWH